MGAYVMSKFAITALIRILRQETRETNGIVVHGIYPGAVDTAIYALSANYFGHQARVLPVKDSPEREARAIVEATEAGSASERQVGLLNWPLLVGYRVLPRVFDTIVGPLMRLGSFARDAYSPTTGNAFRINEAETAP